jgi:hypothetical protein
MIVGSKVGGSNLSTAKVIFKKNGNCSQQDLILGDK